MNRPLRVLLWTISIILASDRSKTAASEDSCISYPCLQSPCPWNLAKTGVDIVEDHDGATATSFVLLFTDSKRANDEKWKHAIETFEHSTVRPLRGHEFVAARTDFSLGFTPPNVTCLLNTSARFRNFNYISSANYENILPEKIDVAIFNDTHEFKSQVYVRASIWLNGSITYSTAAVGDMLKTEFGISSAFLQGSQFALSNKNHFDPTVFTNENKTWAEIKTPPFFRAGGENIGSFFRMGDMTYASVRFNVPYMPSSVDGMGYRSMGIYEVEIMNDSAAIGPKVNVNARTWMAPDSCIRGCKAGTSNGSCDGGRVILNATLYNTCTESNGLKIWGGDASTSRSTTIKKCLLDSISSSSEDACTRTKQQQFIDQVLCAHACRFHNQVYQPGTSMINDRFFTVAGRANFGHDVTFPAPEKDQSPGNPIYLCALTRDFTWDADCLGDDTLMFRDTLGAFGHPIVSSMILFNNKYTLVAPATAKWLREPKDSCSVHLYQWDEHDFSFAQVKGQNATGEIVLKRFKVPASGNVSVICQSKDPGKQCAENLYVSAVPLGNCSQAACPVVMKGTTDFKPGFAKVNFHITCGCAGSPAVQLKVGFRGWHKIYALT